VVWQIRTRARWSIDPPKLLVLFFESLFFAGLLFLFLGWMSHFFVLSGNQPPALAAASGSGPRERLLTLVLFCGAGVYEELVFRVLLLGLLMLAFTQLLRLEKTEAMGWSLVLGASLFSLFHYVGGYEHFTI